MIKAHATASRMRGLAWAFSVLRPAKGRLRSQCCRGMRQLDGSGGALAARLLAGRNS